MVGERRRRVKGNIVLILAIILALGIRFFLILLRKYPTSDEIWAYLLSKADFKSIWFGTLADFHGPFYFLFLRLIRVVIPFELNVFFIRVISVVFGIGASFAIWLLAAKVLGKKLGLAVFYLSLFLPGAIWVSIYGRYYSFLILLTAISVILLFFSLSRSSLTLSPLLFMIF